MFEALADLLVYRGIGLDPASHTAAALHFFVMDVTKIFVMLVLIIYAHGSVAGVPVAGAGARLRA